MRKILMSLLILCILTSVLFFNGCFEKKTNETHVNENASINNESISDDESDNNNDVHKKFRNKVWVAHDETGELYQYTSFRISDIENDFLIGELITGMIVVPNYRYLSPNYSSHIAEIKGNIIDGEVECDFMDVAGNVGTIHMLLSGNNEIKATIVYKETANYLKDIEMNQTLVFKPYNISDVDGLVWFDDVSRKVELNHWGEVEFLSGKIDDGNKYPVESYLVDGQGNIFYDFGGIVPNNMIPEDVEFIDVNEDNLKDLIVLMDTTGTNLWARVLIQQDNGAFFNDYEINAFLENDDNIYKIQDVVNVLKDK